MLTYNLLNGGNLVPAASLLGLACLHITGVREDLDGSLRNGVISSWERLSPCQGQMAHGGSGADIRPSDGCSC